MKSAKRKLRIYEVPISYHGRTYEEGKKIGWKDGLKALGVDLQILADRRSVRRALRPRRAQQSHRHAAISELAGAQAAPARGRYGARSRRGHRQHRRAADGRGACCTWPPRRTRCTCTRCATASCARPTWWCSASIRRCPKIWPGWKTASTRCSASTCWNTWTIPAAVLDSLRATLKPGGALVVLVPNGPRLFGSLDRSLGHKRRYQRGRESASCSKPAASRWRRSYSFNKAGAPPWWAYGKLLGSGRHQQAGAEDFR